MIVCGSRGWKDRALISKVLADLVSVRGWDPLIVHGGARGADLIADAEAGRLGLLTEPHLPDKRHPSPARFFIRNEDMANLGADLCLAFWDGSSTGTADMIERAYAHGIPVEIHRQPDPTKPRG